jgi:chloramphenicol O-acetyltransferase type A
MDVSALTEYASNTSCSFFLASLYLSLKAANEIEELRLRIRTQGVVGHPRISAGSTVLREDETFAFGYFDYSDRYHDFEQNGLKEIAAVSSPTKLRPHVDRDDLIYYSVLPWISFTSFAHARRSPATDCIPRIVFGKRDRGEAGAYKMPISIEVHHALVDGLHVGRFLERFQHLLQHPGSVLDAEEQISTG